MNKTNHKEFIRTDCLHFNGYKPCTPHKKYGVHCKNCAHYKRVDKRILILKTGAAGEVIRCTPLLRKLRDEYPNAKIFWVTNYPELIPKNEVFKIYNFGNREIELIKNMEFEKLYSLEKHEEMGALANQIKAKLKRGFSQKDGAIIPFSREAVQKWKTGIFDDYMKKNKKHYVEEIFEICGFKFNGEKYLLPEYEIPNVKLNKNKKIVALNTGISNAWKPREYEAKNWITLAKLLIEKGYEVIVVGGQIEDKKNKEIAKKSGAKYFGTFSRLEFIGLLSLADIVVTCVSFGFHVAIGLEKKIVLLNNVFNKNEFYMYGNGVIIEPELPCLACYKDDFDEKCPVVPCMGLIKPEKIAKEVDGLSVFINSKASKPIKLKIHKGVDVRGN